MARRFAPRMTDGRSKILCRPAIESDERPGALNLHLTKPSRHCALCFGLPWRVEGRWCLACGLPFAEEVSVGLGEPLRSNAGLAVVDNPADWPEW